MSITNGKRSILTKEVIAVCLDKCVRRINALCGQNAQASDVSLTHA